MGASGLRLKDKNPRIGDEPSAQADEVPGSDDDGEWWPDANTASIFKGLFEVENLFDPRGSWDLSADPRTARYLDGKRGADLDSPDAETAREDEARQSALIEKSLQRDEAQLEADRVLRAKRIHQALDTDKPHENPQVLEDLLQYLTQKVPIWPVNGYLEEVTTVALEHVLLSSGEVGSQPYMDQAEAIVTYLASELPKIGGSWRYQAVSDAFAALLLEHAERAAGNDEQPGAAFK